MTLEPTGRLPRDTDSRWFDLAPETWIRSPQIVTAGLLSATMTVITVQRRQDLAMRAAHRWASRLGCDEQAIGVLNGFDAKALDLPGRVGLFEGIRVRLLPALMEVANLNRHQTDTAHL